MGAISKTKGTIRALFSWEFLVLGVLIAGGVYGAGIYVGVFDAGVLPGISNDIEETTVENKTLNVTVSEDHESEVVVLRHKIDSEDEPPLVSRSLPRYGGTVSIDLMQHVQCSDAEFPSRKFKVQLVSDANEDRQTRTWGQTTVDETKQLKLDEDIVYGDCKGFGFSYSDNSTETVSTSSEADAKEGDDDNSTIVFD